MPRDKNYSSDFIWCPSSSSWKTEYSKSLSFVFTCRFIIIINQNPNRMKTLTMKGCAKDKTEDIKTIKATEGRETWTYWKYLDYAGMVAQIAGANKVLHHKQFFHTILVIQLSQITCKKKNWASTLCQKTVNIRPSSLINGITAHYVNYGGLHSNCSCLLRKWGVVVWYEQSIENSKSKPWNRCDLHSWTIVPSKGCFLWKDFQSVKRKTEHFVGDNIL